MPRVPSVSYDAVEPDKVTAQQVTPIASPKLNQLQGLADAFNKFAEPLKRAAIELEDTENDAISLQGFNQLSDDINSIMFSPETGYSNTQGLDAHKNRQKTIQSIRDSYDAVYNQLKTPEQRYLFQSKTTPLLKQTERSIDTHAAQGLRAYNIGEAKAAIDSSTRNAINFAPSVFDMYDPTSKEVVDLGVGQIVASVDASAKLYGIPPNSESGEALRKQHLQIYASGMMNRYLNSQDLVSAQGFLEYARKYDMLTPEQITEYVGVLKNGNQNNISLDYAFQLRAKNPDNLKAQIQDLNGLYQSGQVDADMFDKVNGRLIHMNNQDAQNKAVQKEQVFGEFVDWATNNPQASFFDLPVVLGEKLKQSGQYENALSFINNGNQFTTNPEAYGLFLEIKNNPIMREEFGKLSEAQVYSQYRNLLNNRDFEELKSYHAKLNNKEDAAGAKVLGISDIIDQTAISVSLFGDNTNKILSSGKKMSDKQSAYFYQFKQKLQNYLSDQEKMKPNGQPLTNVETQQLAKQFATEYALNENNSFENFEKGGKGYKMQLGQFETEVVIPPEVESAVIQLLKEGYVPVTDKNIVLMNAYYTQPALRQIIEKEIGNKPSVPQILKELEKITISGGIDIKDSSKSKKRIN